MRNFILIIVVKMIRCRRWEGHIIKIEEAIITFKILLDKLTGCKLYEGPIIRCKENIRMPLKKTVAIKYIV